MDKKRQQQAYENYVKQKNRCIIGSFNMTKAFRNRRRNLRAGTGNFEYL